VSSLATISKWGEVPLPRPPEESLCSGGVHAVCSMGDNTPQNNTHKTKEPPHGETQSGQPPSSRVGGRKKKLRAEAKGPEYHNITGPVGDSGKRK
jgi:hypothetical protein